jgi:hypothetical protein
MKRFGFTFDMPTPARLMPGFLCLNYFYGMRLA